MRFLRLRMIGRLLVLFEFEFDRRFDDSQDHLVTK